MEPVDEDVMPPEWSCPNCGVLDPAVYGTRCDEWGAIEESWGDNLVCPVLCRQGR